MCSMRRASTSLLRFCVMSSILMMFPASSERFTYGKTETLKNRVEPSEFASVNSCVTLLLPFAAAFSRKSPISFSETNCHTQSESNLLSPAAFSNKMRSAALFVWRIFHVRSTMTSPVESESNIDVRSAFSSATSRKIPPSCSCESFGSFAKSRVKPRMTERPLSVYVSAKDRVQDFRARHSAIGCTQLRNSSIPVQEVRFLQRQNFPAQKKAVAAAR